LKAGQENRAAAAARPYDRYWQAYLAAADVRYGSVADSGPETADGPRADLRE